MKIEYRAMRSDEATAVAAVVEAAFAADVAPGYSEAGVAEFRSYAHARSIEARAKARVPNCHHAIVAVAAKAIVGVIEIRDWEHISMLFVHPSYQRRAIARTLFERGLDAIAAQRPDQGVLTVKSSPFAVPIYERFGFTVTGAAVEVSGLIYVPMSLRLRR